jgi:hypothetical protein
MSVLGCHWVLVQELPERMVGGEGIKRLGLITKGLTSQSSSSLTSTGTAESFGGMHQALPHPVLKHVC